MTEPNRTGSRGVVTMVCITCGNQKTFDDAIPPALTCQCGATVFRQFATPTEPDETAILELEQEARSIAYGDSSPQTTADDVRDLEGR